MQDDYENHHERSGFNAGMLVGLVAGGALGYFFTTEKGKKVLQQLSDEAGVLLENLQENETVQQKIQQATQKVETVKEKLVTPSTPPKPSTKPTPKPTRPKFFRKSGSSLK